MRAWNVVGKYPIYTDGKVTHTEITLATLSGSYGTFTERVAGDQTGKTNDELIELARDAYFKAEYADKAMPEAVQKVDEMSNKLNKKTAEYEETINQMQAAIDKSEKMTQLATATLNELINKMYPDDEGTTDGATESTTDETTKEN
jgi:preprotein translocase subunit SecA